MNLPGRAVAAMAFAALCQCAHADRSRIADDTDVAEAGDCEAETAFERQTARRAAPEQQSSIQLACGIGWRTELAATIARKRSDGVHDGSIGIEAKTLLQARGIDGLGWALEYGLAAERREAEPWRRGEWYAAIEATYLPHSAWLIEAKLGTAHNPAERTDTTLWTLAVEHTLTEAVELRAELSGDDRRHPRIAAALRCLAWPEHALVSLFYGATTGPSRERSVGLGVTLEF